MISCLCFRINVFLQWFCNDLLIENHECQRSRQTNGGLIRELAKEYKDCTDDFLCEVVPRGVVCCACCADQLGLSVCLSGPVVAPLLLQLRCCSRAFAVAV